MTNGICCAIILTVPKRTAVQAVRKGGDSVRINVHIHNNIYIDGTSKPDKDETDSKTDKILTLVIRIIELATVLITVGYIIVEKTT